MGFDDELNKANDDLNEELRREKAAREEAERIAREQNSAQRMTREASLAAAQTAAHKIRYPIIQDLWKKMQPMVGNLMGWGDKSDEDRWMANSLKDDNGHLTARVSYDVDRVEIRIDAEQQGHSHFHRAVTYDIAEYDEQRAKEWVEQNTLEAFKAFKRARGIA